MVIASFFFLLLQIKLKLAATTRKHLMCCPVMSRLRERVRERGDGLARGDDPVEECSHGHW